VARQNQRVNLGKRALVEQQVNALTGRQPVLAVLRGYILFRARAQLATRVQILEV